MLTGTVPFHARSEVELYKQIVRGNFHLSAGISGLAKDLILRLLEKVPSRRLTAAQAANHPWCTRPFISDQKKATAFPPPPIDNNNGENAEHIRSCYSDPWNSTAVGAMLSRPVVAFLCNDVLPMSYKWLKYDLVRDRRNPATAAYWLLWQQLYGIRSTTHARQRLKDYYERRHKQQRTTAREGDIAIYTERSHQHRKVTVAQRQAVDDSSTDSDDSDNSHGTTQHQKPQNVVRRTPRDLHRAAQHLSPAVAAAAAVTKIPLTSTAVASVGTWMTLSTQPETRAMVKAEKPSASERTIDLSAPNTARSAAPTVGNYQRSMSSRYTSTRNRPTTARPASASALSPKGRRQYRDLKNKFAMLAAAAAGVVP